MKNSRISVSALLLLELICAILIFSLSASVCVLSFTKSHKFATNVDSLRNASLETTKAAELIRSCSTSKSVKKTLTKNYTQINDYVWTHAYGIKEVRIVVDCEDNMVHAEISYHENNEMIDSLTIDHVVKDGEQS